MSREKNDSSDVMLPTLKCNRCGHEWFPRRPKLPERCPACNSPYWNKPRVKKVKKKIEA